MGHDSDCAVHSEPAYPAGECNCNACDELHKLRADLALPEDDGWMPIESAPHGDTAPSILLGCAGTPIPVYCGRLRFGTFGEPQKDLCAWRCDSSGRFANPTHWAPLRNPPKREASGEPMPYRVVRDGDKVRFE